jgi:hypothetical protein
VPADGVRSLGILALVFGIPVFAVSATRHLLRGLLWRVGSRLVVSYLLLLSAVVFAAFFVYAGLLVIAGQLGTRRVEAALEKRRAAVAALAHELSPRLETARASSIVKSGSDVFAAAVEPRAGRSSASRAPSSGTSGLRAPSASS